VYADILCRDPTRLPEDVEPAGVEDVALHGVDAAPLQLQYREPVHRVGILRYMETSTFSWESYGYRETNTFGWESYRYMETNTFSWESYRYIETNTFSWESYRYMETNSFSWESYVYMETNTFSWESYRYMETNTFSWESYRYMETNTFSWESYGQKKVNRSVWESYGQACVNPHLCVAGSSTGTILSHLSMGGSKSISSGRSLRKNKRCLEPWCMLESHR
jgi:hypothetical protein